MTTSVAVPLRVVAAARAGAHVVARPRGVVHLAPAGPLTPSGSALPRAARTVCRARTGRLYLFTPGVVGVPGEGRRFCRRCTAMLPISLGSDVEHLRTRDDDLLAYGHLTVADFTVAAVWCRTVEETHQVGRIALVVLGSTPVRRPADRDSPSYALWTFEQALFDRRRALAVRALSPEELAAREAERDHQALVDDLARRGRARGRRLDRLHDMANQGRYLTRSEREEIGISA
ncbi:hypothetical protein [Nocardioides lianchengensis]|uniref:Uncharacterized protein n=1 Tax=Nocardioides lianchengensis TaxID=1045774 RepID=A0A1G6LQ88_9ACTN|nr:hypothetical protein [Nocardioides lianchengensis]NYG12492.1 hypothetical protein [Nocardioides lianchengensis]SDC44905.1 hypothetical protein SAMN05421872_102313 [Nocardioides lianchengensis]